MDREPETRNTGLSIDADAGLEPMKAQGKVTEIQGDSNFYETVTAAPLDPWSKTSLQLYAILLVASLNATASGFDGVRRHHPVHTNVKGNVTNICQVHLQLHQCHVTVPGILSSRRARKRDRHHFYDLHHREHGMTQPALPISCLAVTLIKKGRFPVHRPYMRHVRPARRNDRGITDHHGGFCHPYGRKG